MVICILEASNTFIRYRRVLTESAAVSGGFAIVQPGSQLSINAVEGYPIEDFSKDVSGTVRPLWLLYR